MEIVDAIVAKSGENCIQVSLSRSSDGLLVKVWALPKVEDFVRSLGTGETLDVQTIGRHWQPAGKDKAARLMVYELSSPISPINVDEGGFAFRLDHPGYPLTESSSGGINPENGEMETEVYIDPITGRAKRRMLTSSKEMLNLGFLRFAGISGESGVSFVVRGVYTREGINSLASKIEQACVKFYKEFLKPYRMIVTVSTMPIPDNF